MDETGGQNLSPMVKAELAVLRLDEIDELMRTNSNGEQHDITNYLKDEMDLHSIIEHHNAELANLREDFIQAHVDDAESICALYTEFVDCENKLVEFEEEIITFQRRLADSADDMVKMYQQTVGLVQSVNNRRLASAQLSDVYTVLQECDAFCEAIAHKEVDKEYLENISELEKKLSFLSRRELQGSAVDLETRPRLEAAAARAGDKVQRYLTKRITALAAENGLADIARRQVELAGEGQNAISFLTNYNRPVAAAIFNEYAKRMSDVFTRHIRASLRALGDVCASHAAVVEPIVSAEEVKDLLCNRDAGSPRGCHVFAVVLHYPVHPLPRRDRSVSQHMRTFADRVLKSDHPTVLREATFADTVEALFSLHSNSETLSLKADAALRLDRTNSWTWQFARSMHLLVNLCITECHFIAHFFCCFSAARAVDSEVYDEIEALVRVVLTRALDVSLAAVRDDLPLVADRQGAAAGLRVLQTAKAHLSRLDDPVPLLLLSGVLEQARAALSGTLRELLANDRAAVEFVAALRFTPFQLAPPATRVHLRQLLEDPAYAATLGPHPIVQKFARVVGEMNLLNCANFAGAIVDGTDVLIGSSTLSGATFQQLERFLEFMRNLSGRHRNTLAQRIFAVNNLFYILSFWSGLVTLLPPSSEETRVGERSKVSSAHVTLVRSRLSDELVCLVDEESRASGTFGYLFEYLEAAEAALDGVLSSEEEAGEIATDTLPEAVSESAIMKILLNFSQNWLAQLHETVNSVKRIVTSTMVATCDESLSAKCGKELEQLIIGEYTHNIMEANKKLHKIVSKLFSKNADIHAKLTSNATLLQVIQKGL